MATFLQILSMAIAILMLMTAITVGVIVSTIDGISKKYRLAFVLYFYLISMLAIRESYGLFDEIINNLSK